MSLLEVRPDPTAGFVVIGRYSGRHYFASTDETLAAAVADEFTRTGGMLGYEVRVRQETCPHDDEVEISSFGEAESRCGATGVMRVRLRDLPSPEQLAQLYATPHQHDRWVDHQIRVDVTVDLASYMLRPGATIADLSCGDSSIARRLAACCAGSTILGDFAPGYEHTGPIEETVHRLRWKQADLFVLSETVEHLDDPNQVLRWIREKTDALVLSTPDGETDPTRNPEHVWGFDSEAVGQMLRDAGFTPWFYNLLDLRPAGYEYAFQIWACR
jgi:hypothetical protein